MSDDLQDYLDSILLESTFDSTGAFSLDLKIARQKLAHFYRQGGLHFLHDALRFCLALEPPELSIQQTHTQIALSLTGQAPELSQLRTLFGQTSVHLRALQMALVGCFEKGWSQLELSAPGREAVYTPDEETFRETGPPCAGPITLTFSRPAQLRRWFIPPKPAVSTVLDKDFAFCATAILTEKVPWSPKELRTKLLLSNRPLLHRSGVSMSWAGPGPPVLVALTTQGLRPAQSVWLNHGTTLHQQPETTLPPNLQLVVDLPIPLDLSLRQAKQDWKAPTTSFTKTAASLICRALLERPELATEAILPVINWVLQILLLSQQWALATALGQQIHRSALWRQNWVGLAILEQLIHLRSKQSEESWPTLGSDLEITRAYLQQADAESRARWRVLTQNGWPAFPACPTLTAACQDLNSSLCVGLVEACSREGHGSEDRRRQTLLLQLLATPRRNYTEQLLLARELVFLDSGFLPEEFDRSEITHNCAYALLDARQDSRASYGYGLARALLQACPTQSKTTDDLSKVTQSLFLAAQLKQREKELEVFDTSDLDYLFLTAWAELRTDRPDLARIDATNLFAKLLVLPPSRRKLFQYRKHLTELSRLLKMDREAIYFQDPTFWDLHRP